VAQFSHRASDRIRHPGEGYQPTAGVFRFQGGYLKGRGLLVFAYNILKIIKNKENMK
jgi:hypothetical protein